LNWNHNLVNLQTVGTLRLAFSQRVCQRQESGSESAYEGRPANECRGMH
jgi:hypothetical protein